MSTKFKTSFIGILGKDAELKQIGNNNYITLNVAKSEKQGQENITDWVQCNKFAGNSPSNLMQYLKKGTKVFLWQIGCKRMDKPTRRNKTTIHFMG